jgi:hypothetical protein
MRLKFLIWIHINVKKKAVSGIEVMVGPGTACGSSEREKLLVIMGGCQGVSKVMWGAGISGVS